MRCIKIGWLISLCGIFSLPAFANDDPLFRSFHYELEKVGLILEDGDYNEDGNQDLAAWVNGKVRLFPGNGDGTFENSDANEVPELGSHEILFADLNRDNHLDLIGSGGPWVFVRLGHGDGSFGATQEFKTSAESAQIVVADLSNDGLVDLAVANEKRERVHVLRGKGDGTFHPSQSLNVLGESPRTVAAGDFNNDQTPDLAFAVFQEDYVALLINTGSGFFEPAVKVSTFPNPRAVDTGDFNEDQLTDLVVSSGGGLQVHPGDGQGGFGPIVNIPLGSVNPSIVVADFNEDGHQDLGAPSGSGWIALALGKGDGTFESPNFFSLGDSPFGVTAGDWNKDGELDLAAVDFAFDGLTILLGRGDGNFAPHHRTDPWPVDVNLVDLDGDGVLDLVTANETDDSVSVLPGLGNGWFDQKTRYPGGEHSSPTALAWGDFTDDGIVDVATASAGLFGGKVTVFPGNGDLTLGPPMTFTAGNDLRDLKTGDVNKDGNPDLVTVSNGLGRVYVLLGLEGGGFAAPAGYDAWLSPSGVVIGDFNEDTWPDLITANDVSTEALQLFLNRGNGTFESRIPITTNLNHQHVKTADLNFDTHLDLISTGNWGQRINIYLGNGDGTFQAPVAYDAFWNPNRFDIGDVNNDDILDVVVARQHQFFDEGSLGVFLGNGDGTLQDQISFELMDDTYSVALGDVDGDGVLDAAAAVTASSAVTVMKSSEGPWDNLGHPLPGVFGFSRQAGEGPLVGETLFRFRLDDAVPFASTYHVIGLSRIDLPYKGGVLVPDADFITGPFILDGAGRFFFEGMWPQGVPAGTEMFFQFWYPDPGGPAGFGASNALQATTP
ncbi:MAG: FG-GAP repeat domain-containing protein [Planctomycetota bacterium]|jgi:hypothetical protein